MMTRQANQAISRTLIPGIALGVLAVASVLAGPLPPVHYERDIPAKVLARPVVVYNRPYTGAIFADYVPDAAEVNARFAPAMARNEYEPMQVGLYVPSGSQALKDVTLEVSCDLPCRVGHIYYTPANELSWMADTDEATMKSNFPGMTWPVDAKLLVNKRSSIPLYVLPVAQIAEIQPGRSAAFWVTFKTDEKTWTGAHKSAFVIKSGLRVMQTVPFVVRVYPFALPRPKVQYGMYYMPYQTPAVFQGREWQKLYLADMASHGMNLMDLDLPVALLAREGYGPANSAPLAPPEGNSWGSRWTRQYLDNYLTPEDYQADGGANALKLIDNQARMGQEAGLIQRDHPCVGFVDSYNIAAKKTAVTNMRKYGASRGWPSFAQYMRDEPGPDVFGEVIRNVGEWRRLGVEGIAAMNGLAAFGVGQVHSAWIVHSGQITPELLREAARLGSEVWTYDFNLRATNAEAGRFYAGLYTWSLGLKGNIPYAYMECGNLEHPIHFDANWRLSEPSGLGYVVPSPAGPLPGVGWEGRREGVDDVRYLQLLEARVNAAPAKNPTARAARQWLASLRQRSQTKDLRSYVYNAWGADYMDPNKGLAPGDYDAIRARAAAFILKLPAAPGELNPEPSKWLRLNAKPLEEDAFAKADIAECMNALRTGSIKQKREAAGALATRKASEILPARELLVGLLDKPEARVVALRALANLGPDAAPAIPDIRKLLDEKDAWVRLGATYTLTTIGRDAADALSACVNDPDTTVADLARAALDKIKKQ